MLIRIRLKAIIGVLSMKLKNIVVLFIVSYFIMNAQFIYSLDDNDKWESFLKNRNTYIKTLAYSIIENIKKQDSSYPIFHGCIDWHSAVHGHWALLRAYRMTKGMDFFDAVTNSINEEGMYKEYTMLQLNPNFEMPYGRAWFLKLIMEYEIVTKDQKYRYFSDYVAKTIKKYLLSRKFDPAIGEYDNLSWAYRCLLEYYIYIKDSESVSNIRDAVNIPLPKELNYDDDTKHTGFFSIWGNLVYLHSLSLSAAVFTKWVLESEPNEGSLKPIQNPSGHLLGINYSRAWSLWSIVSITQRKKYLDAYVDHIMSGMNLHEKYKDSYDIYGHWVPQFGIYAISESFF